MSRRVRGYVSVWSIGIISCAFFMHVVSYKKKEKRLLALEEGSEKLTEFYFLLLDWLRIHREGRLIADYFMDCKMQHIAIYGFKELGEALFKELAGTEVNVDYVIDREAGHLYIPADVYRPDEVFPPVDAVVVTAIHYYEDIRKDLSGKMDCPILSLADIVGMG